MADLGSLQPVACLGTLQLVVDLGSLQLVAWMLEDFGALQVGMPVKLGAMYSNFGKTASEAVLLSQKTSAYHVSQPYVEGGSSPPIWGRVDFQGLWPCSIFPDFSGENGLRSPHV